MEIFVRRGSIVWLELDQFYAFLNHDCRFEFPCLWIIIAAGPDHFMAIFAAKNP